MKKNKGIVLGKTDFDTIIIFNQESPYIQSTYFMIESDILVPKITSQKFPCEVMDVYHLPCLTTSNLPEGIDLNYLLKKGYQENKLSFFAYVKPLIPLTTPILPESKIVEASFDEIASIVFPVSVKDGFIFGQINGTDYMQESLPDDLKNIAPMFDNYKATYQEGIPFLFDFKKMTENPHVGFFGSSGSGKTKGQKVMIEECMRKNLGGLIFDPHNEMDFLYFRENLEKVNPNCCMDYTNHYQVFQVGKEIGIHFEDLTESQFLSLFQFLEDGLTDAQKNVIQVLFYQGIPLVSLKQKITTLISAFDKKEKERSLPSGKKDLDYSAEELDLYQKYGMNISGASTLKAFLWKLQTLENKGIFVGNLTPVIHTVQNNKFAVLRGSMEQLKLIGYFVMHQLYYQRISYIELGKDYIPPFFIFIDEAQNFAPDSNTYLPTKSFLRKLSLEARKYGIFLCLATQRTANLDKTLLTQINSKFIFRLLDMNDIETLRTECNLTNHELNSLPDLQSGNAYVSSPIYSKKYFIKFRCTHTQDTKISNIFDEVLKFKLSEFDKYLIDSCPIHISKILNILKAIEEDFDKVYTENELKDKLDNLVIHGYLKKEDIPVFGIRYIQLNEK